MKRITLTLTMAFALMGSATLNAQTIYDAARVMGTDLNGTARFVGMGGAMGALGGDITTMGTNPAGIGIYRGNDAMVSFGFSNIGVKSTHGSSVVDLDKSYGSFDNVGFVFSSKIGNQTALKYVNFGFNYRKVKSFNKDMLMNGTFLNSQTEQMASMLNGSKVGTDALNSDNVFYNQSVPWLGAMAYNAFLVNPINQSGSQGYAPFLRSGGEVDGIYNSKERGGLHAYDFNVSFNFYDRIYLGATLGTYSIDYRRNSTYSEFFYYGNEDHGNYQIGNDFETTGSGVDFKLGMIVRPFEDSPFRIGAAIHTPTFYNVTESNYSYIDFDVYNQDAQWKKGTSYPYDSKGLEFKSETDYDIVTPWKYNLSLGYTVGSSVALGAEYEYSDYSSATMKYDNGVEMDETMDINDMFKGVHTLRLGAEFKLAPEFAFRVGYNHVTAAMKDNAYKILPSNTINTSTEYSNLKATNNYTFGFGYRGEVFYADMAYQFNTYKEDFYAFDNVNLAATKVDNKNHKLVFTLGMRF